MGNLQILLRQHVGAPCEAIVKAGDRVEKGTLIATPTGLGANIFSSAYGEVVEVTEDRIIIKPDEEQKDEFVPIEEGSKLDMVKAAGVVGMGGAGFPTGVKLGTDLEGGYILINAAECEPGLRHNIQQIEEECDKVIRGVKYSMEISNAAKAIFAIKKKNTKAVQTLKEALKDEPAISIHLLPDIYPMGEERAIIREVLGKLLKVTDLPLAADAIVTNAETACRIQEAVDEHKPFIDKDMTVAGKIAGNEQDKLIQVFLDVPLGTKVSAMFEKAGGLGDSYGELIMGGPFTGKRTSPDAPVIKTTGGLIATECFPKGPEKIGVLVCACSACQERMEQIAASLGSEVVGVEKCKQAKEVKGSLKCENPGRCPGQVQKVMALKKAGAQAVLIGNCTDCSNTVMSCAPQLGLPVYHSTDAALRAVNFHLIRKIKNR